MDHSPPEPTTLAALDHAHRHLVAAETAEIIALAHLIDTYHVDMNDIAVGLEDTMTPGADGTPAVAEFLALEIAPLLGVSPGAAVGRLGDVLNVRHRLPTLWAAVLAGRIRWWQAVDVARRSVHLSAEAALTLDRRLAHAMALMPWQRTLRLLPGWIIAADPANAIAREASARTSRHVTLGEIEDGHVDMWGRLTPDDAAAFDHALSSIARTLPATADVDQRTGWNQRRAAAVGILARGAFGQESLPSHQLVVHITADSVPSGEAAKQTYLADGTASGTARVEGWGAMHISGLRELLAGSRVTVRPVLDPNEILPVDQHDPPDLMRLALTLRNPVDVFPYGSRVSRTCDLDHTVPYRTDRGPGQTSMENLGPTARYPHRARTHGGWHVCQPQPGTYHWRSPAGYEYLVTAVGTIRLTAPPELAAA